MRKLWLAFLALPLSRRSAVLAFVVHALLLAALLLQHAASRPIKTRHPILIRTIAQSPTETSPPSSPSRPPKTPPASQPAPSNPAKPTAPPSSPRSPNKKTPSKTPQPNKPKPKIPAPPSSATNESLLSELMSRLEAAASVSKETSPIASSLLLPKRVELSAPAQRSSSSLSYGDAVASLLQNTLDLPEIGKVVARIDIDSSGTVVNCEILQTQSQKNSEFLKKRLQELVFPCFNEFALSEGRLNFTITFQNVENR